MKCLREFLGYLLCDLALLTVIIVIFDGVSKLIEWMSR